MAIETNANDFETKLNGAITTTTRPVTFSVQDAVPSGLTVPFRIRLDNEYLKITAVASFSWTGDLCDGATAATHLDQAVVDQVLTRDGLNNHPGAKTTTGDLEYLDASGNVARLPIGVAGQILGPSGSPLLPSWQNPAQNTNSARIYRTAALTLTGGSVWTKAPMDTVDYDPSSLVTIGSSRITVTKAGKYMFTAVAAKGDTTTQVDLAVYVNGTQRDLMYDGLGNSPAGVATLNLAASDYVELFYKANATPAATVGQYNFACALTLVPGQSAGGGGGGTIGTGPSFLSTVDIDGLAGSPDARVGGANDDEFDQNTSGTPSGWTSFGSPDTIDTNTAKSHLHMKTASNGSASSLKGIYKAAPSIPFTVTAKLSDWASYTSNYAQYGGPFIVVMDASTTSKAIVLGVYGNNNAPQWQGFNFTNWTTYSADTFTAVAAQQFTPIYLRIVVTAANNIDVYVSHGGQVWTKLASAVNFLVNATYVGLCFNAYSQGWEAMFDWIRFS